MVLNVELAKLDFPLDHSSCGLELVHRLLDGLVRHHQDRVCLEVGSQLAQSYDQCECNLFDPWVPSFYPLEGLTDVVH